MLRRTNLISSSLIWVCQTWMVWRSVPAFVNGLSAPLLSSLSRDSERDKVAALDKGADDYLTKPFGIEELLARVRVALRHSTGRNGQQSKLVKAGSLTIDLAWHIVNRNGEKIKLTGTEYKFLAYLAANHGRVLTHQSILTNVWGPADADHTEYLRVYMRQLRKKLEADPEQSAVSFDRAGHWLSLHF